MARLPTPGSDIGNWGDVLNDYLSVSHNPDGTNLGNVFFVENFGAKGDAQTDDTAAINACFDAASKVGGVVTFQAKTYRFTALNFTNANCVTIQGIRGTSGGNPVMRNTSNGASVQIGRPFPGAGWSGFGTVLIPLPGAAGKSLVDFSGSQKMTVRDLQIGISTDFYGTQSPVCGILIGHVHGVEETEFRFDNVYVAGRFSAATLYYGGTLSNFVNCQFYNYHDGAACIAITKGNYANVSSTFLGPLDDNPWYAEDTIFQQCQFHEFGSDPNGHSSNYGVVFDGAQIITFEHVHATSTNYHFAVNDSGRAQIPSSHIRIINARLIKQNASPWGVLTVIGTSGNAINGLELTNIYTQATNYFVRIESSIAKIKSLRILNPKPTNQISVINSSSSQPDWLTYSHIESNGLTILSSANIADTNVFYGGGSVNAGITDNSKKL